MDNYNKNSKNTKENQNQSSNKNQSKNTKGDNQSNCR